MGGFDAVRGLAATQQGVVTVAHMRSAGLSMRQVERAAERGELVHLHRGIYRVGPVTSPYFLEMAASLVCGRASAVSHRSAPYLYGMLPRADGPVHITVSGRHLGGHEGIVIHETSSLKPHEIRERHGIPLTAPVRTLVDLARIAAIVTSTKPWPKPSLSASPPFPRCNELPPPTEGAAALGDFRIC